MEANYNSVLSLSSAELGRNLHLAGITSARERREGGKGLLRADGAREAGGVGAGGEQTTELTGETRDGGQRGRGLSLRAYGRK